MSKRLRDDLSPERVVGQDARSMIAAEVAGCSEHATCLRNASSNDECFRVGGWRGGEVSKRSYIYLRSLLRYFYVLHNSKVESRSQTGT